MEDALNNNPLNLCHVGLKEVKEIDCLEGALTEY
jgi:hypothetical protein